MKTIDLLDELEKWMLVTQQEVALYDLPLSHCILGGLCIIRQAKKLLRLGHVQHERALHPVVKRLYESFLIADTYPPHLLANNTTCFSFFRKPRHDIAREQALDSWDLFLDELTALHDTNTDQLVEVTKNQISFQSRGYGAVFKRQRA